MEASNSRILDMLQNFRFWLVDVVPSATWPFFVLGSPIFSFNTITSPEITLDGHEVKQINSMFKKHVYVGGSVGQMTLTRGCRAWDDSFYQWVKKAIDGNDMINRNLLLIHYTGLGANKNEEDRIFGPGDVLNIPGRAWMLWDAIPLRYKSGSDFDAMSSDVSIMELDIQPWAITEFALMAGAT